MRTTTPRPASRTTVIEMTRAQHTGAHQRAQARAVPRAARKIQVRLKEHDAVQPSRAVGPRAKSILMDHLHRICDEPNQDHPHRGVQVGIGATGAIAGQV